jgi:hypothetical protein
VERATHCDGRSYRFCSTVYAARQVSSPGISY